MLFRNMNLAGPYPISRDGKLLGEFLQAAIFHDAKVPVFADVEIMSSQPLQVDIRLRKPESIAINPGFRVVVQPNKTFSVATDDGQVFTMFRQPRF